VNSGKHVRVLIGRYLDGVASPTEVLELENALECHPSLRGEFLSYLAADSALAGASPAFARPSSPSPGRAPLARKIAYSAVAAVVILALGAGFLSNTRSASHRTPAGVATLAAANDALWADPNTELALRAGLLPADVLRLEAGTVEFICAGGATVILRGPAEFHFPRRKEIFLERGLLHCRCPSPQSRITVTTPATEIRDLGTEFTVAARADRSTRVAVLSGEVAVGGSGARRLRKGEAVEVRSDGLLAIQSLSPDDFTELQITPAHFRDSGNDASNQLQDPGFENELPNPTWNGTEHNIESVNRGRHGKGVRVMARGIAHWPQCHQSILQENLSGRLVMASVWAAVAPDDPLRGRQTALLKIAFKNAEGRDFAFVCKRFLGPKSEPGRFEKVHVAAFAPKGTARMQIQMMLQTDRLDTGSVIFDDATLLVADRTESP
jgi:hypothetical protein